VTSPPGLGNDALELVHLLLGANKGAQLLLGELAGTLVLAVAEKFNNAALIGGEARNFLDDGANKLGPLAEVTLGPPNTGLDYAGSRLVTLVDAGDEPGLGSVLGHLWWSG